MRSLDDIYAAIPSIDCKGLCHGACGPVSMSTGEELRMLRAGHVAPDPQRMLASGCLTCPLLTSDNRCAAYDQRPVVCRLYGVVPFMRCEHGCEPERWLTDREGHQLVAASMEAA